MAITEGLAAGADWLGYQYRYVPSTIDTLLELALAPGLEELDGLDHGRARPLVGIRPGVLVRVEQEPARRIARVAPAALTRAGGSA